MDKHEFRILIADDDEIAREVITALLSHEGYRVTAVNDGLEAMDRLRSGDFHFVITDLKMPGADGIEVLKFAVRSNPDAAVVILTAYGTLDTTLEAMNEGAYDYLTKPFKTQEVLILTERAYQRALLIADNRELKRTLRDTYRDMDLIRAAADAAGPEMTTGWLDRVERLRSMKVLAPHEADALKERLVRGYGKG